MAAYFPQTALCLNRLATEGVGDFAALERDLLAALKYDGARWVEQLLNDPALPGNHPEPQGEEEDYGRRGRKGKNGGRARTREVKVGTVFTHRKPEQPDQRPQRDYASTTYLAAIVSAEQFGPLLRADALRRGIARAKVVVILGDGAVWVWKLARLNFPNAVCILDYYHACEHLHLLSATLYGEGSPLAKKRYRQWRKALLKDRIDHVIAQAQADLPTQKAARRWAQKQIAYFERNRSRMQYATFRHAGYFIGSGVVEAGCKTVVGQRLKHSGMLWSRQGASHLLTVRCALLSGWFNDFWKHDGRAAQGLALAA